jgi:hypothetical protein
MQKTKYLLLVIIYIYLMLDIIYLYLMLVRIYIYLILIRIYIFLKNIYILAELDFNFIHTIVGIRTIVCKQGFYKSLIINNKVDFLYAL